MVDWPHFLFIFLVLALRSDVLFSYSKCHKIAQNPFKTINDRADDERRILLPFMPIESQWCKIFRFGFGFILLCVRLHFDVVYNGQETHFLRTQSVKNIRMTRTNSAKFAIELPFFPVDYLIYMQNGFNEQVSEKEVFSFIYKNLYQPS